MAVQEPQAALDARAPGAVPEAGTAAGTPIQQASLWRDAWRRYIRNKGAVAAAIVFIVILLYAFLIPGFWIVPGIWTDGFGNVDPYEVDFSQANQNPSSAHPFGTDQFGRDLFARAALGGQVSIGIGFAATIVILVVAIIYGGIAGFAGGAIDNVLMRFLDALYGLPFLPFAIITLQIVGTVSFLTMVIALSIVSWFTDARVVRGQIITLKENDYVRAARAVGARWYRILGRHLLPNTLGILIISMFLSLPAVVLGEAFISFIGLGINPPKASWGSLAFDGREAYRTHPITIWVPSLFIAALILCANFIADGLRDALDPRTRET
jgi:oligopeptide transport system permease protein